MKTPLAKSVLAIVIVGIALIGGIIWFGLHSHKKPAPVAPPPVAEKPAAPVKVPKFVAPAPAQPVIAKTDDSSLAVIPISLTNVVIAAENNVDAAMKVLPQGTQIFGGIEFWLQGAVQLQSLASRDEQRKTFRTSIVVPLTETNLTDGKAVVTQRGKNIASLYILGATRFASLQDGEKFADLVWHYADGTLMRSGLQYDVHLRDWARKPYESPAQLPNTLTKVAWHGSHPTRKDRTLRLYRVALVNPHPEKVIQAVEFASAMARPSMFVCALTLDPLMPGARPDNLTSEEMADPELNGQLQLYVQDAQGHPLPDARVVANSKSTPAGTIIQKFTTDNNGMALVRFPDTALDALNVSAIHDDFSDRKMLWDLKSGDTVPATYTLKLAPETQIGGIVVDPESNPITGAEVSLYRFWSGNDMMDMNKKGEQADFSTQNQTTDAQGRWLVKGLPSTLLDHIGFNIKHPDYITAQANVGDNGTAEKQLRDGTYKTIMQRGLDVHGRVVDSSDVPIPGATVWAGERYSGDRKQVTSDADGQFSFHTVATGDVLFAVLAKGHSPANKTVSVQADTPEIVFRLGAANIVRAHVQDESGQPIAGARVQLDGNGDPSYEAYEFSGTTDSSGNFSWDGAPAETMSFYVYHEGFEDKRGVKLPPDQDNTVILHAPRTLSGVVLDASTGQPVTKFTVRTGTYGGDGSDVYGVVRYKEFTAADGKFSLTLEEESDNAVAVYADDYATTIQKFPEAQNGTVSVTVQMNPSASLSGVVVAPDGTPAPDVTVGIASEKLRTSIQLSAGHLRSYSSGVHMAVTDAQGHFKIAAPSEDGIVLAAGDLGFASVPLADVRSSSSITLLAWGRIEGTLKIGGQPGVGKDLLFNLTVPGARSDFIGYRSTTDDQGKFTMEQVPPGDGEIIRLVKTSPNSWDWSDHTAVTIKPGETTQISLGGNGALIAGRIRFDNPPTNNDALSFQSNLSMPMPAQPTFNSPAEATAYYHSAEWKAALKLRKSYALEMKPDGTFTTYDVAPGEYVLTITVRLAGDNMWQNPPVAQGSLPVIIPDSFDPTSPINVGEVVLQPPQQQ